MKKWRRCLCVAAACVLMCGAACAKELPEQLQRLMDLTAAAALDYNGQVETITADGTLPPNFVYQVMTLGQRAYPDVGITPEMLGDTEAQRRWLEANYFGQSGDLAGILWIEEEQPRVTVRVTDVDLSDDGDAAVVKGQLLRAGEDLGLHVRMDARRDAGAACGWKVLLFGLDGVAQEESADALFAGSMVEYISPELGFSVQFPAIFAEVLKEESDGITGALKDQSAAFEVQVTSVRARTASPETILAEVTQAHPDALVQTGEADFTILRWTDGATCYCMSFCETEDFWWHAQISWDAAKHPELEQLSEYMMNSLSVDALGVG